MANQNVVNAARYFTDLIDLIGTPAVSIYSGKVYYVHKGGDNAGGLSWEHAFTTIAAAIAAQRTWRATLASALQSCNAYIFIAPGTYDENITSFPFSTTIIGLGIPGTDKATEWHTTTGACMAGTVSGLRLVNIRFEAGGANDVLDFNICNNVEILNCDIQANETNKSAISTMNSGYLTIRNCKIGTGGGADKLFDYGIKVEEGHLHNAVIENNIIQGLEATGTGIYIPVGSVASQTIIRNNVIKLTGAGQGIDDDSDDCMVVGNTVFHVNGTPYDYNAALASQNIANNNGIVTDQPNMG